MTEEKSAAGAAPPTFTTVRTCETEQITRRRQGLELDTSHKTLGLAISGGGIRSATFALGVIQLLARHRLIRRLDYLSTVSGGGYIGSWLTAWLFRWFHNNGTMDDFECALAGAANRDETQEIRWLRANSNYLAPRLGVFNADGLSIAAIWLRNCASNVLVLFFLMFTVLLAPRLVATVGQQLPLVWIQGLTVAAGTIALVWSVVRAHRVPRAPEQVQQRKPCEYDAVAIALLYLLGAGFAGRWLERLDPSSLQWMPDWIAKMIERLTGVLSPAVYGAPLMGAVLSVLLTVLVVMIPSFRDWRNDYWREWWGRLGAWTILFGVVWMVISWVSIDGAQWITNAGNLTKKWAGVPAWVISLGGVFFSALSERTPNKGNSLVNKLLSLAPYLAVAGILLLVSTAVQTYWLWFCPGGACQLSSKEWVPFLMEWTRFFILFGAVPLWCLVIVSLFVDVNDFSMHHMYRNRLVRCYLGASIRDKNDRRTEDQTTGFAPSDDIAMHVLAQEDRLPVHIVNAAVNLSNLDNSQQSRRAAMFTFSQKYCGFTLPRSWKVGEAEVEIYGPTEKAEALTLGQAFTISGAAASPNMGYHTSPILAFLMTMFNVRLGWWFPNPASAQNWGRRGPEFGLKYLVTELFASATEKTNYLYLSDGGHFENLGVYELLRRECRYVICADGSADPDFTLEGLADLVRKARADLNVEIDIDTTSIRKRDAEGHSKAHCAVGRITYRSTGKTGILLYLKTSITGNEDTDILQYHAGNPQFPHQSTADQFFSEAQFESYRRLGWHAATTALQPAIGNNGELIVDGASDDLETLFVRLRQAWGTGEPTTDRRTADYAETLANIMERLRRDDDLRPLDSQIFLEWNQALKAPGNTEAQADQFYVSHNLIQLMETIYLDLDLEWTHDRPDSAAWINLFRRLTGSDSLRIAYAITAGTFNGNFRSFCARHLNLEVPRVQLTRTGAQDGCFNKWERQQLAALCGDSEELAIYRLYVSVPSLLGNDSAREFTVGFAVVEGARLIWIRIQNHLRAQGFGRDVLRALRAGAMVDGKKTAPVFSVKDAAAVRERAPELAAESAPQRRAWVEEIVAGSSKAPPAAQV